MLPLLKGAGGINLYFSNILLGVDQNRAKLAQVAVQQIASKGKLQAEELFGQLAEASPGAVNVLARSQGMSVSQLRKLAESGGIDVSDALPRFGQQLKAESQGSADAASKSADAALGRLQNAGTGINEAFGNQFMLPAVLGMELASKAAGVLANNFGLLIQVISSGLIAKLAGLTYEFFKSGAAANLARNSIDGFKEILTQSKKQLFEFAGAMAAVYLGFEIIKGVIFSLDGGPFKKLAEDAEAAFDRIDKASEKTAKELKEAEERRKNARDEFYGKDRNIFQKGTDAIVAPARDKAKEIMQGQQSNPVAQFIDWGLGFGDKSLSQMGTNIDQKVNEGIINQDRTISANSRILAANNRDRIGLTPEQVNRRAEIEDELRRLKVEQLSYTSRDRDKLATNLNRTQSLIGERSKLEQPINDRQGELESLKKSSQELIDGPFIAKPVKIQAKLDLAEADRQLRELQAELSIVSDKAPNKKLLDEIVAKFEGIGTDATVSQQRQSIERNRLEVSGQLTKGGAEYDRKIANIAQSKNKFLAKLNGFGGGLADGYISAVLDIFEATKKRFEIDREDYQAKKRALEAYQDRSLDIDNRVRTTYNPGQGQTGTTPAVIPAANLPVSPATTPQPTPTRTVRADSPSSQPAPTRSTKPRSSNWLDNADPKLKSQLQQGLRNLTPAQRKRYVETNMSVDGKTDLGFDDFDRRVLGMGGGIPGVKVKKIGISSYSPKNISTTSNRAVVDAINNGTYRPGMAETQSGKTSIPPAKKQRTSLVTNMAPASNPGVAAANTKLEDLQAVAGGGKVVRGQIKNVNDYNMGAAGASRKIYDQTVTQQDIKTQTAREDAKLQEIVARQKTRKAAITATREVGKQTRQQEFAVRNAAPARTIQEKQQREIEDFDFNTNETKLSNAQYKEDLGYQVSNLDELLKEYQSKPNLKPEDLQEIERLTKLRATFTTELGKMKVLSNGLEAKIAAAKAKVLEEQKYQNSVTIEQTGIKERESKRIGIDAERTGIQQQLKTRRFSTKLKARDRQLEEDGAMLAIANEEIQALGAIIEAERNGNYAVNGRTPTQVKAYVASKNANVKRTYDKKRQDVKQNRSQRSSDDQFTEDNELRALNLNQLGLDTANEAITDRVQAVTDRTDAPYANNTSIDRELAKKLKAIADEKAVRDKKFLEDKKKYSGNDELRGKVDQQYTAANLQSKRQEEAARLEAGVSTTDRQSSRRTYLYDQNQTQISTDFNIYDVQTAQQKLLGQDTRARDFTKQKLAIQNETDRSVFAATERKAKITADTPEAEAEHTAIDKLIASLKELNTIKLDNLAGEFNQLNQVISDTQKSTTQVFKNYITGGKKFDFLEMLSAPLISFGNQQIDKIVPGIFGGLYKKTTVEDGAGTMPQVGGMLAEGFNGVFGGGTAGQQLPVVVSSESPPIQSNSTPEIFTTKPPESKSQSFDWNTVGRPDLQPVTPLVPIIPPTPTSPIAPESFTIPPAPKSQYEGMPQQLIRTEIPGGYIEMPAEQTNNLLGSNSKLETDIPVLTSSIDNLTNAIINNPLTSGLPVESIASSTQTDNSNLLFSPNDDPFSFSGKKSTNPVSSPLISNSLLSGLTGLLGKGQSNSTNTFLSAGASLLGGLFGFATGGIKGDLAPINSGIIRSGRSQVDNRLALVEDGEGVLTHLGVDTLGGASALSKINRGIKVPMFANGGIKGANYSSPTPDTIATAKDVRTYVKDDS